MCGCKNKIGSMRNLRNRKVSLSMEDGLAIGAGVLGGLALNSLAEKAVASQSQAVQDSVGKFLPYAKIAIAGGVVVAKKAPRAAKMGAIGVGAVGAVEAATKLAPQYFQIGTTGETYRVLGTGSRDLTRTPIPVVMGAGGYDDYGMEEAAILGNSGNHHEELAAL